MTKLLHLTFITLFANSLVAQPTVSNIGPAIGDTFTIAVNDGQEYDPGLSGANQTYDFSGVNIMQFLST